MIIEKQGEVLPVIEKKVSIILKSVVLIVIGIALYACSPKVEEVRYSELSTSSYMHIYVNTYRGLLKGRDSFLEFKRDSYSFNFDTKGKTYTEKDVRVGIWSWFKPEEDDIRLKQAKIEIQDDPPKGIFLTIEIHDERIPKLINGKYRLSLDYKDKPVFSLLDPKDKDTETLYTFKR